MHEKTDTEPKREAPNAEPAQEQVTPAELTRMRDTAALAFLRRELDELERYGLRRAVEREHRARRGAR